MLRAVMDTINDDTLLPALVIEMKNARHCPGHKNGCAKCAMRLRRPDNPGEAEEKEKIYVGPDNGNWHSRKLGSLKGWEGCKRW
jgi:hypothetical protein